MSSEYTVTEVATGRVVSAGDLVSSFRGESGTFEGVERGPQEHHGMPKVAVREPGGRLSLGRNANVWGLRIRHNPTGIESGATAA
ncbi:MAG TPA: hypothetical protein VFP72_08650, partial [Kineosporiaceae bacterium]|nr:hypothetical protein [Kineosporiaceae bacterium]